MNHSLSFHLSIFVIPLCLLCGCMARGSFPEGEQSPRRLDRVIQKPAQCGYWLFLPRGYHETDKQWPLILFLHGSGERGAQLELVKHHGPPQRLDRDPDFPFIVVSPQCPDAEYWDNDVLMALLDDVIHEYRVDADRVYLTGLSMGGWGTWNLACAHPGRFAAIAPVSGWGLSDLAPNLKSVPIWAFHGEKDTAVPLVYEQEMVDEVRKAGGQVKFTVIPGGGHGIWTQVYADPAIYSWFLEHRRGGPASQP